MALNPKQQRFVEEYLVDLNATQAAIRAKYSEKTARSVGAENLTKPDIAKAIQEAMAERSERTEIDQDYVLTRTREVVERCMQTEGILDREGNSIGQYQFSHAGVLRGLELLGKHLGLFTEKHELSGKDGDPITLIKRVIIGRADNQDG